MFNVCKVMMVLFKIWPEKFKKTFAYIETQAQNPKHAAS